jgi:hypothetical protein
MEILLSVCLPALLAVFVGCVCLSAVPTDVGRDLQEGNHNLGLGRQSVRMHRLAVLKPSVMIAPKIRSMHAVRVMGT